ncbi:MAG: HDOD domain-containing protein, partial [Rubrivivax sp.]
WLQAESEEGGGPVAVLLDRLRSSGALPSSPGAAARAARLAMMERERIDELADVVLEDLALSFEMLRLVNTAQVRGSLAGGGPVLAVRRSIALLGLSGVRRAALALRPWPGPLDSEGAQALQALVKRCRHAARTAVALRPAGYDAEVVFLIALLQNLSRLMLHYHFADEARQVLRLQLPLPSAAPDGSDEPGLSESAACHAVLGVDLETLGAAVARQWGLVDEVMRMIRRHPLATPVRAADDDADVLRAVASCANEAVDSQDLPAANRGAALRQVAQRYGRQLQIGLPDLLSALKATPQPLPRDPLPEAESTAPAAMPPVAAAASVVPATPAAATRAAA